MLQTTNRVGLKLIESFEGLRLTSHQGQCGWNFDRLLKNDLAVRPHRIVLLTLLAFPGLTRCRTADRTLYLIRRLPETSTTNAAFNLGAGPMTNQTAMSSKRWFNKVPLGHKNVF